MELRFDKNKMKEIVEKYYREYEDFDGVVTAGCSLNLVGYGMAEHEDTVVSIKVKGTMKVLGMEVPMTREVDDEELFNIFRTVLGNEGHTIKSLTVNSGVNESTEGYGMGEHTVKRPYFRGVIVNVKEKNLVR